MHHIVEKLRLLLKDIEGGYASGYKISKDEILEVLRTSIKDLSKIEGKVADFIYNTDEAISTIYRNVESNQNQEAIKEIDLLEADIYNLRDFLDV